MLIEHDDNNDTSIDTLLESQPMSKFSESMEHLSTKSNKTQAYHPIKFRKNQLVLSSASHDTSAPMAISSGIFKQDNRYSATTKGSKLNLNRCIPLK